MRHSFHLPYNNPMRLILIYLLPILTVAWSIWGAYEYRKLKAALALGHREALLREYRLTIVGEVIFGLLSVLEVGTGILRVSPAFHVVLPEAALGVVYGLCGGAVIGLLITPLLAKLGKLPPMAGDFAALLPQLPQERLLFVFVAFSAGVCEELLFRGFGLRFFAHFGLAGFTLLLVAASAFGLLHLYQGIVGVLATFVVGLLLSVVYIVTGSLLVPIVLHTLIDLRPLTLPSALKPEMKRAG